MLIFKGQNINIFSHYFVGEGKVNKVFISEP